MTSKANYQQDLWPDDIASVTVISPKTIVEEQGKILGQKTNNLIVGELKREDSLSLNPSRFPYDFSLYCSSLNYRYDLFRFIFDVTENYPVYIKPDAMILKESFVDFPNKNNNNDGVIAESEEELIEVLRKIFSSSKTRKVIAGILSQLQ